MLTEQKKCAYDKRCGEPGMRLIANTAKPTAKWYCARHAETVLKEFHG